MGEGRPTGPSSSRAAAAQGPGGGRLASGPAVPAGPPPPGRAVLQGPAGPGGPGGGGPGGRQGQGPAGERQARLPAAPRPLGREPPAVCPEAGAEAALVAGLRQGEGAGAAGPGDRCEPGRPRPPRAGPPRRPSGTAGGWDCALQPEPRGLCGCRVTLRFSPEAWACWPFGGLFTSHRRTPQCTRGHGCGGPLPSTSPGGMQGGGATGPQSQGEQGAPTVPPSCAHAPRPPQWGARTPDAGRAGDPGKDGAGGKKDQALRGTGGSHGRLEPRPGAVQDTGSRSTSRWAGCTGPRQLTGPSSPPPGFSITEGQRKQAMLKASKLQAAGKPKGEQPLVRPHPRSLASSRPNLVCLTLEQSPPPLQVSAPRGAGEGPQAVGRVSQCSPDSCLATSQGQGGCPAPAACPAAAPSPAHGSLLRPAEVLAPPAVPCPPPPPQEPV